jgi:hypothetical protein
MAVKGVLKMMEPTMVSGILLNEPTCAPACTPGPAVTTVPYNNSNNNTTQVHAAGETGRTMKEHMEMPTEKDPLRKSNTQNDGIDHASLCVASRCRSVAQQTIPRENSRGVLERSVRV